MTDKTSKNQPDFYVHVKVPSGDDDTRIGSRIGAAFYHREHGGLNIILDAMPIPLNGKIELVAFAPKDSKNND